MKTNTKTRLENLALPTALSLLALTSFASMSINSSPAHAESTSASANASVTVSDTIRLTLTGGDLVINNLTPGTSADSNIITATVTSNSPYGFHLSATTGTKNGTTSLVNTADSNFSFTNLNVNKASLNDFSDNTWGYSYSTNDGTSWVSGDYGTTQSGYNGLSLDNDDSGATGTTLFNSDSYTNSTAVKFKIGAKSSSAQASGTYTGTVNFYAVTNPGPDNTMQGFAAGNASTTCTAMSTGDTLKLKDSRDNTEYTIGKLADGKCWLLDNLALDLVTHKNDLTSSNTNASDEILAYLKNGGGSGQYAANEVKAKNKDGSGGWTNSYTDPYIATGYENDIPSDAISQSRQYKIGVYYNYCAASAGSYCYADSPATPSDSQNGIQSIDADICPKGWRMPTGDTSGEYSALANAIYGSTGHTFDSTAYDNYRKALRLPLSGGFLDGSANGQGSKGIFWSSTYSSSYSLHMLYLDSGFVDPAGSGGPNGGISVRCVLDS